MRTGRIIALGASLVVMVAGAWAADKPDASVRTLLEKLKLKYEVDTDNDYALPYEFEDKRSQMVYVLSDTETIGEMKVREVWSIAGKYEGAVPAEVSERLMTASRQLKVGSWEMDKDGESRVVVLVAKVPTTATAKTWKEIIEAIAVSADEMEKELTGKDDL